MSKILYIFIWGPALLGVNMAMAASPALSCPVIDAKIRQPDYFQFQKHLLQTHLVGGTLPKERVLAFKQFVQGLEDSYKTMSDQEILTRLNSWAEQRVQSAGYLPGLDASDFNTIANAANPRTGTEMLNQSVLRLTDRTNNYDVLSNVSGNLSSSLSNMAYDASESLKAGDKSQAMRTIDENQRDVEGFFALEEMKRRLANFSWTDMSALSPRSAQSYETARRDAEQSANSADYIQTLGLQRWLRHNSYQAHSFIDMAIE